MSAMFEDLQVLKSAEAIADSIWRRVAQWDEFAKDVVGKQITRSADSVGANIAESFGRYNFGEKLQFLYYSRGSLFETKYWLNRANARELMNPGEVQKYIADLTSLARQLNTFASGLKTVRSEQSNKKTVRESAPEYVVARAEEFSGELFPEDDFNWLNS
ncbi:MAG: four helix bundle protein [Chloroflexi bacterium]|nr:four helix bundle protein [Chloroflexota bacterium]